MDISPDEAKEALAAVQKVSHRTRRSMATGGAYIFLMITGFVWLVGFLATQFLTGSAIAYVWVVASLLGSGLSVVLGLRVSTRVRGPLALVYGRRIGLFWALLAMYCVAIIIVAQPEDAKQLTTIILLFTMLGQLAMGLLFSFTSTWWAMPISALMLIGYFFLPGIFWLWMGVLVGGTMIALGLYIRLRW